MPSTPYARLQVAVNGGGVQTGGITAPASATIQLSAESTVGWGSNPASPVARWEISSYPSGFGQPAGWSTDPVSGAYYYLSNSPPPSFALGGSSLWGKYMLRLLVDGGLKAGVLNLGDMEDTSTAISVVSTSGLKDLGYRETNQFSATKKWTADHQANLRVVETTLAAAIAATSVATPNTIAKRDGNGGCYFAFLGTGGAPIATQGDVRLNNEFSFFFRDDADSANLQLLAGGGANSINIGQNSVVAAVNLLVGSTGNVLMQIGSGATAQLTSTLFTLHNAGLTWSSTTSPAPVINQQTRSGTGANAGADLSVTAQAGQQQTGGANNNNGGRAIVGSGPPGTGGSGTAGVAGDVLLKVGSTTALTLGGSGALATLASTYRVVATGMWKYIRRTSDHAGVTNSTAVVDDGVLEFAIGANEEWIMEAYLALSASVAGSHRETITAPSGASGNVLWQGASTFFTSFGTDLGEAGQANAHPTMTVWVVNGANAGTVKVRYAQFASDGTATVMKAGSYLRVTRVA